METPANEGSQQQKHVTVAILFVFLYSMTEIKKNRNVQNVRDRGTRMSLVYYFAKQKREEIHQYSIIQFYKNKKGLPKVNDS